MPTYHYKHPKTNKIYEDHRIISDDMYRPFISKDGAECQFVPWYMLPDQKVSATKHAKGLIDRNCEVWDKDRPYVKKLNPKWVRTRDGKKIRYNPNTMG